MHGDYYLDPFLTAMLKSLRTGASDDNSFSLVLHLVVKYISISSSSSKYKYKYISVLEDKYIITSSQPWS